MLSHRNNIMECLQNLYMVLSLICDSIHDIIYTMWFLCWFANLLLILVVLLSGFAYAGVLRPLASKENFGCLSPPAQSLQSATSLNSSSNTMPRQSSLPHDLARQSLGLQTSASPAHTPLTAPAGIAKSSIFVKQKNYISQFRFHLFTNFLN